MPPIDSSKSRRSSNKPNKKGKNRAFSSPEEIEAQLEELKMKEAEDEETSSDDEESSSDDEESTSDDSNSGDSSDEEEELEKKAKGVSSLIADEIENPNRFPKKLDTSEKVELTRREREELERQRKLQERDRLIAEGKTEESKADLERLALIRARREQEAAKRKEEQDRKAAEAAANKKTAARVAFTTKK